MKNETKILVFYIGVGNIRAVDISEYVNEIAKKITPSTFEGEIIIIPINGNNTRVECINPKYISDDKLITEHEKLMHELNINLKNQLKEINTNKNDKVK